MGKCAIQWTVAAAAKIFGTGEKWLAVWYLKDREAEDLSWNLLNGSFSPFQTLQLIWYLFKGNKQWAEAWQYTQSRHYF